MTSEDLQGNFTKVHTMITCSSADHLEVLDQGPNEAIDLDPGIASMNFYMSVCLDLDKVHNTTDRYKCSKCAFCR